MRGLSLSVFACIAATTVAAQAAERREFYTSWARCFNTHPVTTKGTGSWNSVYHEVRNFSSELRTVCGSRKCELITVESFTVKCQGGPVSAARFAMTNLHWNKPQLRGDTMYVPIGAFTGQGGELVALRPGEGVGPSGKRTRLYKDWEEFADGSGVKVLPFTPVSIPAYAAPPWYVALFDQWWPWAQLILAGFLLAYGVIATIGFRVGRGEASPSATPVVLVFLAVAGAGIAFSASPANMPKNDIEAAHAANRRGKQEHAALVDAAKRDRARIHELLGYDASDGMFGGFNDDQLTEAKALFGTEGYISYKIATIGTNGVSLTGSWTQSAFDTAGKHGNPSETTRAGFEMRSRDALDLIGGERPDRDERDAAWPSLAAGCDRHHERDLVRPRAPALSPVQLAFLAAEDGVVHLDAPIGFTPRLVLGHHGGELLAQEPGAVVFDAELARQFEARDRVLRLREEEHRLKPRRERQERFGEDRAGAQRVWSRQAWHS